MGEGMKSMFHGAVSTAFLEEEEEDGDSCGSVSFSSDGSGEDSIGSSSSDHLTDDATSPPTGASPPATSPSHQLDACGPVYELSSLMAHLPIKRGLSKFFSGKSQSFKSLSSVTCVEDLAKKETPYKRKMKPCKSYGGTFESYFTPGPYSKTISKKSSSRGSCASLATSRSNYSGPFAASKPPPPVPVQKKM